MHIQILQTDLHTFYKDSGNLVKDQSIFPFVFMSLILTTFSLESVLRKFMSFLELKGINRYYNVELYIFSAVIFIINVCFYWETNVCLFVSHSAGQTEVKFIASRLGSPDLPPWLLLEQDQPTDRAFIYGTPGPEVSSQIVLEVQCKITAS